MGVWFDGYFIHNDELAFNTDDIFVNPFFDYEETATVQMLDAFMHSVLADHADILAAYEEDREDFIEHYGQKRRSGRYKWGSGDVPYQHESWFVNRVQELRKEGMKEIDIAKAVGCKSTGELRAKYSNSKAAIDTERITTAKKLAADGLSKAEIARQMNTNESTIRGWLKQTEGKSRATAGRQTADILKKYVDDKGMIDVGEGVDKELGISRERMKTALELLKQDGYSVYTAYVPQINNGDRKTTLTVLAKEGTPYKDIFDFTKVSTITDYTIREDEEGNSRLEKKFEYPASLDSKRLMIRYRDDIAPDGHAGVEKDGTIEIRRGCKDLDLGNSNYAQVRIMVDGDKYLKGMAFYSDNLPDGVDVIFNTNKTPDKGVNGTLKPIHKEDPNNPFGALLREQGGQYHYKDDISGEEKLGLINKCRQEGDWGEWADRLPSQFLSKQPLKLIDQQLSISIKDKQVEFDDIMGIENPTVKKELLNSFAEDCDKTASTLAAASLPRQKFQVILPVSTLKDNEVYAPNYQDGEKVALIRYPHGSTSEIPILTVNNKHADAKKILGQAEDAIGINSRVAERLSGADFDGDTVQVIPCNSENSKTHIVSTNPIKELEGFDPKIQYAEKPGMKYMKYTKYTIKTAKGGTKTIKEDDIPNLTEEQRKTLKKSVVDHTGMEMGVISNLITDMTLKGATVDGEEMARAIRHSMVVIDAAKHKLDYKQSEIDNGIDALKRKYQQHPHDDKYGGATTLISRSNAEVDVLKTRGDIHVNSPDSAYYDPSKPIGAKIKVEVRETYIDKNGKEQLRKQKATRMSQVDDAYELTSTGDRNTPYEKERRYADYANTMKDMANKARAAMISEGDIPYNKEAATRYAPEVARINAELKLAELNAPRERQAQLAANSELKAIVRDNPMISSKEKKKLGAMALARARTKFNAHRHKIDITPKEWEAIQSGAISPNVLKRVLRFADSEKVRQYATPRAYKTLTPAKEARIRNLAKSGYSAAQIATTLGISQSSVKNYMSENNLTKTNTETQED